MGLSGLLNPLKHPEEHVTKTYHVEVVGLNWTTADSEWVATLLADGTLMPGVESMTASLNAGQTGGGEDEALQNGIITARQQLELLQQPLRYTIRDNKHCEQELLTRPASIRLLNNVHKDECRESVWLEVQLSE